jgi:hypothetical protein
VDPGHDALCERGHWPILDECHCHARTYRKDPPTVQGVDPPWGLFAFQPGRPDTRGHEQQQRPA